MELKEGYKNSEVGLTPKDWIVVSIDDIAKVVGGGTPNSFNTTFWNGEINWYTPTEIGNNKYVYESERKISKEGYLNSSANLLPPGTILLTSRAGIGDLAILINEACTNQGFQSLIANEDKDNEFLYYLISTLKSKLLRNASGSTFLEISPGQLKKIKVAIPPKKIEQTSIADALSFADKWIQSISSLIVKKQNIKQGVIQELLNPKDEWDLIPISKIGKTYGGLSGKSKNDFENGTSPYIPFMNVMTNPIIDVGFFDYVNIGASDNQNKAQSGDLFFNTSSETPEEVGMCAVLLNSIPGLYLNSFCFGFRLHKNVGVSPLFLSYLFRSNFGREKLFSLAQGSTRYNLSTKNFVKIEIKIPKFKLQTSIAQTLFDMDEEIKTLQIKLTKAKQIKEGMMQNLLTGKIRLI